MDYSKIVISALKSKDVSLASYDQLIDEAKCLAKNFTVDQSDCLQQSVQNFCLFCNQKIIKCTFFYFMYSLLPNIYILSILSSILFK